MCHENPTWPHCLKSFCALNENKGKNGCPSLIEDCMWNGKCTYDQCQGKATDSSYPSCSTEFCTKNPSDVQCWNPSDLTLACEYGDSSNCTPEICVKNPTYASCTDKFCALKTNKGKYGCATATEDEKCEWN